MNPSLVAVSLILTTQMDFQPSDVTLFKASNIDVFGKRLNSEIAFNSSRMRFNLVDNDISTSLVVMCENVPFETKLSTKDDLSLTFNIPSTKQVGSCLHNQMTVNSISLESMTLDNLNTTMKLTLTVWFKSCICLINLCTVVFRDRRNRNNFAAPGSCQVYI